MIHLADQRRSLDADDALLTRQERRALRQLAAVAPQLLRIIANTRVGFDLCPTWRRVQTEAERRAAEG